jgi:hypothetical protein
MGLEVSMEGLVMTLGLELVVVWLSLMVGVGHDDCVKDGRTRIK